MDIAKTNMLNFTLIKTEFMRFYLTILSIKLDFLPDYKISLNSSDQTESV